VVVLSDQARRLRPGRTLMFLMTPYFLLIAIAQAFAHMH
jgi:hypothetical protein